jgi:hypothetical protein
MQPSSLVSGIAIELYFWEGFDYSYPFPGVGGAIEVSSHMDAECLSLVGCLLDMAGHGLYKAIFLVESRFCAYALLTLGNLKVPFWA